RGSPAFSPPSEMSRMMSRAMSSDVLSTRRMRLTLDRGIIAGPADMPSSESSIAPRGRAALRLPALRRLVFVGFIPLCPPFRVTPHGGYYTNDAYVWHMADTDARSTLPWRTIATRL